MVQGVTFDKQLLASEDFAHQVNYFYQGKMGVSKGCEISTGVSGNLVISDGYFSIYGRLLKNVGDTVVEVPSVPSGTLYSSLVFEVDLTKENTVDQFNQGQFKVVSNATKYPTLVQEDLDNGGMVYQLEFARFENTVNGIVNLQDKRTILSMQMYTPQDDFNSHLADMATSPTIYTLPAPAGFSGETRYQKGFKNMTTVLVDLEKTTDFEAAKVLVLGTLPVGYRPTKETYQVSLLFNEGGSIVPNALAVVYINVPGEIRVYTMPGGTFANARRVRGVPLIYYAS